MKNKFFLVMFLAASLLYGAHAYGEEYKYDGKSFSSQEDMDKYKKEKEESDKYIEELKAGTTDEEGTFRHLLDDKWYLSTKTSALGDRDR